MLPVASVYDGSVAAAGARRVLVGATLAIALRRRALAAVLGLLQLAERLGAVRVCRPVLLLAGRVGNDMVRSATRARGARLMAVGVLACWWLLAPPHGIGAIAQHHL